jgi:hypothetical protein
MNDAAHPSEVAERKPQPVIFPIWKPSAVIGLIACAPMLFGAIVIFNSNHVGGTLSILGVIGCAIACAVALLPRSIYVELTQDGLAVWYFRKKVDFVRWTEVETIRAGWLGVETFQFRCNEWVFLDYSRDGRDKTVTIMPFGYGFSAEELTALLSSYRDRAQQLQ